MTSNYLPVFLLFVIGLSGVGHGQSTYKFRHLGAEDGLSHPSVTCILKDRHGFMWIGTRDGLNRYDSYEFRQYKSTPGDSTTLSNNTISCLFEDHQGSLWIGTEGGGLNRYDPVTDRFQRYMHDPAQTNGIPHNSIGCILEDRNRVLWVGTRGGGLSQLERKEEIFTTYAHDPEDPNSLGSNVVMSMIQDDGGSFWIATEGAGLAGFDPVEEKFKHYRHDPGDPASISTDLTSLVFEDSKGRIWLGSWGFGLNIFDRQTEKFTRFVDNPDQQGGLPNNNVFAISEDDRGKIWMGTRAGLSCYDPRSETFTSMEAIAGNSYSLADNVVFSLFYSEGDEILWVGTWGNGLNILDRHGRQVVNFQNNPENENSLNDNDVFSLFEDREGIIWIGTEGGGLNRYDPSNGFRSYVHDPANPQSISNDEVMCIHQDQSGQIWLGTYGGGLNIFDPEKEIFKLYRGNPENPLDNRTVLTITEDSNGFLWLTTGYEGVVKINPLTGENIQYQYSPGDSAVHVFNEVLAIIEDHTGAIWFGSRNNGLSRLNPLSGEFTFFSHDPNDPGSLGSNAVYAFHEDTRGNLWIGTRGAGINILNLHRVGKPVFEKITTEEGLVSDWILGIEEDQNGNIWATGFGISKITADTREVRTYRFSESNQGAFFKSPVTGLFYLGAEGFDVFHPDSIKEGGTESPVVISSLSRYHTSDPSGIPFQVPGIFTNDSLTLSYREKLLTFEFLSLDYSDEQDRQYAYLLEDFNDDWIQLGTERKITFIGLSPGSYNLRVKSVSPTGKFGRNEADLSLRILPPWWRSGLAYGAYVFLFLLGLYGFVRLRTRKLKKDKDVLESIVQERTREIAEQKDEIETQRDQLQIQRDLVLSQKSEIIDSINYARRIQAAMLPPLSFVDELLNENFILYKPKNIVSGDFYWAKLVSQKTILVAGDSTGHGVPGAFMSMLGISYLDEIVARRGITQAHKVLNELRYLIKHSLRQQGRPDESKDGIDMAICVLDESDRTMQYAGANNPLYIVRDINGSPELIEIKPDRMPLGYYMGKDRPFTKHEIQLEIGDTFYMFSDGYADQKGGKDNKKYMIKNFKNLLLSIQDQSMYEQKISLEKTLEEWQNGFEQIDDILVMGVRVQ